MKTNTGTCPKLSNSEKLKKRFEETNTCMQDDNRNLAPKEVKFLILVPGEFFITTRASAMERFVTNLGDTLS